MDKWAQQSRTILESTWRNRWLGVSVTWLIAILGALAVVFASDRYEATARVYVDTQTVLKPLMQGLAFHPDTDQEVRMLARTLISRPNIERLMKLPEIALEPADSKDHDRELAKLMDKIKVSPSGAGNLYAISYRDTDPQRARRMVETLVNMFGVSNADNKKRDSDQASKFIEEQLRTYEAKLVEAESRLKEFKVRNFGLTGVSNQDYFARMSVLSEEVSKLRVELSAAEQSRGALKRELAAEEPQLPLEAIAAGTIVAPPEIEVRLDAQKRQLDELLRRYTDAHPDVIAAHRAIAQIEQQMEAQRRAPGDKHRGAATSPVFQRIRIALAETEASVAALRTRLSAQQAHLDQTRAMASRVPQVEAEFAQLNRDYDVIRKNYEQMVARREAALLGGKIDETTQLADFRVVEPARLVPGKVFPSRATLAAIAMALALVAGVLTAYALTLLLPSFGDETALRRGCKRPVIGSISAVVSDSVRLQQRRENMAFAGVLTLFFAVNGAWVAWISLHGSL